MLHVNKTTDYTVIIKSITEDLQKLTERRKKESSELKQGLRVKRQSAEKK